MRSITVVSALLGLFMAAPGAAQTPEDEVLRVVERLFDGMRAADTTAMRATFHPQARLVTTGERGGEPVAVVVPIDSWLRGVAESAAVLDEQIYDPEVRVSGGLATVWTYYTLHVDGRFSHCGYDAFQLGLTADGWKITNVADTRKREGCRTPGDGA